MQTKNILPVMALLIMFLIQTYQAHDYRKKWRAEMNQRTIDANNTNLLLQYCCEKELQVNCALKLIDYRLPKNSFVQYEKHMKISDSLFDQYRSLIHKRGN